MPRRRREVHESVRHVTAGDAAKTLIFAARSRSLELAKRWMVLLPSQSRRSRVLRFDTRPGVFPFTMRGEEVGMNPRKSGNVQQRSEAHISQASRRGGI